MVMESRRIAIVEDEVIIAEDLRQTLFGEGYCVTGCYTSGEAAFSGIQGNLPELVLIDVRLKGVMTGIDLAVKLRSAFSLPIIYVTASSDEKTYRLARGTQPQAFLVKPFNQRSLLAAVDLALDNHSQINRTMNSSGVNHRDDRILTVAIPDCLFVRVNGKHKKIHLTEFLYIEANGSYINIVTTSGRYTLSHNLGDFQRKVHAPQFVRVHRSFIVNMAHVDSFDESFVYLNQNQIPLSKSYRNEFQATLNAI